VEDGSTELFQPHCLTRNIINRSEHNFSFTLLLWNQPRRTRTLVCNSHFWLPTGTPAILTVLAVYRRKGLLCYSHKMASFVRASLRTNSSRLCLYGELFIDFIGQEMIPWWWLAVQEALHWVLKLYVLIGLGLFLYISEIRTNIRSRILNTESKYC